MRITVLYHLPETRDFIDGLRKTYFMIHQIIHDKYPYYFDSESYMTFQSAERLMLHQFRQNDIEHKRMDIVEKRFGVLEYEIMELAGRQTRYNYAKCYVKAAWMDYRRSNLMTKKLFRFVCNHLSLQTMDVISKIINNRLPMIQIPYDPNNFFI